MGSIIMSLMLASLAICLHSVSGIEYNPNPYTSHGSSGFSQALDYSTSNSLDYGDYGGLIGGGNVGSGASDLDETSQYLNVLGSLLQQFAGSASQAPPAQDYSDSTPQQYSMQDAQRSLYQQQQPQQMSYTSVHMQPQQMGYGQMMQPQQMGYGQMMEGYGMPQQSYGQMMQPHQQMSYGGGSQMQQGGYGGAMAHQSGNGGYGMSQQNSGGYGQMGQQNQNSGGYGQMGQQNQNRGGYGQMRQQNQNRGGYGQMQQQMKSKIKKVFVPIVIRKRKEKKKKIIAIYKGFYIPGGTQIFGKFKKLGDCKKACGITPSCFSADFNPSLKKCYIHSNTTACANMRTHPKIIHFKKVPCGLVETPRSRITLGTNMFGGLEQKGVKNLQDCIKKCASAGNGIAVSQTLIATQTCFAIDYDFGSHKCYLHTDPVICVLAQIMVETPRRLSPSPGGINIILCPISEL